jgi:pyruvate dehydrogenase E1 component alpha subunit
MRTIENIKEFEPDFLRQLLTDMLLIRRVEEKAAQMYGLQKIGGFCHLYIGQEAVAVGSIAALDLAKDYVLTAYRDHGHALACGMEPNALMAELYGKQTGCSKGKGGSMHLFDADKHMLGGNGIVGGHVPVATGVALKTSIRPRTVWCSATSATAPSTRGLPRKPQPGQNLEPAHRLHLREQPVWHGH